MEKGVNMDSQIFETASPTKIFFRCAIPAMISMAVGSLYQIADGIFVGRFIGGDALAAVNLIMPLIMIVFAISNMIATGASVRISILLGRGKREKASSTFTFVLKIIFIISLIVGVIGFVFAEQIVKLLGNGATEEAIQHGVTYIRVYAIFNPIMPIAFATDNFLRICGKETISMWLNIIPQLLNIVLDIILIAFLGQGVWAAAFTSCISMTLAAVFTLLLFKGKKLDLYYTKGKISISEFLRLLTNGTSAFLGEIAMSVMSVVFNFYLLKYGGTTGVAAFSVLMYVDSFVGMLVFGMCDSIQPPISYCYGARQFSKVKALLKRIMLAGSLLAVISFLFMFFAGQYVAPFFIKPEDTELMKMSFGAMTIFSFSYLFGWVDMVVSSFFRAIEKPVYAIILSLLGTLLFPIGSLIILTRFFKLDGVWLSSTVSGFLIAIVAILMLRIMKLKDITSSDTLQ